MSNIRTDTKTSDTVDLEVIYYLQSQIDFTENPQTGRLVVKIGAQNGNSSKKVYELGSGYKSILEQVKANNIVSTSQVFSVYGKDAGEKIIETLKRLKIIDTKSSEKNIVEANSRINYNDICIIKIDLFQPCLHNQFNLLGKLITSPIGYILSILSFIGQTLLCVWTFSFKERESFDWSFSATIYALLLLLLLVFAHEYSHAIALERYGAKPGKIGFMLYFFLPGFYCDVTEVWTIERNNRNSVYMAGAVGQLLTSIPLIVLYFIPVFQQTLTILFLFNIIIIVTNFYPFLKLDGYYILSNLVNIPNLYHKSIQSIFNPLVLQEENAQKENTITRLQLFGYRLYGILTILSILLIASCSLLAIINYLFPLSLTLIFWILVSVALLTILSCICFWRTLERRNANS